MKRSDNRTSAAMSNTQRQSLLMQHETVVKCILGVVLLLIVEGQFVDYFGAHDTCLHDRAQSDSTILYQTHRFFSKIVFGTSIALLVSFLLILAFWSEERSATPQFYKPRFQTNWHAFFICCYSALWYGATYGIILVLKRVLGDFTCGQSPNSISGHFSFFLFYSAQLLYLAFASLPLHSPSSSSSTSSLADLKRSLLSPNSSFSFKLLLLSLDYLTFLCFGLFTVSQTLGWGYHTPRQALYGVLSGLLSQILLALTLRKFFLPPQVVRWKDLLGELSSQRQGGRYFSVQFMVGMARVLRERIPGLALLALFQVAAAVLLLVTTGGLPLKTWELVGMLALWPLLMYLYFKKLATPSRGIKVE
ncbi:hypothetical protein QOT17_014024 [Balamuthia mandrillaris]